MVQVLTLCGANVVSPEGSFPDTGTMIPVKIVLSDPTEYTDQNSLQGIVLLLYKFVSGFSAVKMLVFKVYVPL